MNDTCQGAFVIPPEGPFPELSPVTPDISGATVATDPANACVPTDRPFIEWDRGVWYVFTPSITAPYTFSTCGVAGTTMESPVIAVYASNESGCPPSTGAPPAGWFAELACDNGSCADGHGRSEVRDVVLEGGHSYFIVVSQFQICDYMACDPPAPGYRSLQLRVDRPDIPVNDTCAGARPIAATTGVIDTRQTLAANDYTLAGTACFEAPGETPCTGAGRDTVYSFAAPVAGAYSIRVQARDHGGDLLLYTSPACPAPGTELACDRVSGVVAANRNPEAAAFVAQEEISCLPLAAGQTIYVFVDECSAGAPAGSGQISIEVSPCSQESEPNGSPASAGAYGAACPFEGSFSPAGDVDFFALGTHPEGSRVFTSLDTGAMSNGAAEMRVTTASSALQYGAPTTNPTLGSGPSVDGIKLTSAPAFVEVNAFPGGPAAAPYRLYTVVQPPGGPGGNDWYGSSATREYNEDANASLAGANFAANNYFLGTLFGSGDIDLYRVCADAGDVVVVNVDANPSRGVPPRAAPPVALALSILDAQGSGLIFNDFGLGLTDNTWDGSLLATTPYAPGGALAWRARSAGPLYVAVAGSAAPGIPHANLYGDYLLSIGVNCRSGSELVAEFGVAQSLSSPPVAGSTFEYTLEVTNSGPDSAQDAYFEDEIPLGTTFAGLTVTGDGARSWDCTVPAMGATEGVTCTAYCVRPGSSTVFHVRVRVDACIGNGVILDNFASALTPTPQVNYDNDWSDLMSTVNDSGTCDDGNPCTLADICQSGLCVGTNLRTCPASDACHAPGICEPMTGLCTNPSRPDGTTCDDDDPCTAGDHCAAGTCVGTLVENTYYRDVDDDGYGDLATSMLACTTPAGYVRNHDDCNDTNPAIHPGAVELCNGVDEDCNGIVDDGAYASCVNRWTASKADCQSALAGRLDQAQAQLQTCMAAASGTIQVNLCTNAYDTGFATAHSIYRSCINQANLLAWNCARMCPSMPSTQTNTRPVLKH
jgi:uncharacterized repeat protein (TIGR01451 family)